MVSRVKNWFLGFWKTVPIILDKSTILRFLVGFPKILTSPLKSPSKNLGTKQFIVLARLVFPDPLSPRSKINSPFLIFKLMLFRAFGPL